MKVLVTGASGFIAGYLISLLLEKGHAVIGIDNFDKYGPLKKSYDKHPRYTLVQGDAKDADRLKELATGCDQIVAMAAKIGGISYFHEYAYDLMAENERILAATFDAAIHARKKGSLQKINVLSSSMVYENATTFPSKEGDQLRCPPPSSTYGFQKLASEFFAKGAHEQYGLPYTIIRPFNCVGVGEARARGGKEILSGNVKLAMSHVVPDLILKTLSGQDPLHILGSGDQVRHYTYGKDLAEGILACMTKPAALNEDFNISTNESTTVKELATLIWKKIKGDAPLTFKNDPPFPHDVQMRTPDTRKAKEKLGFEATTPLDKTLDVIIPWIREQHKIGTI